MGLAYQRQGFWRLFSFSPEILKDWHGSHECARRKGGTVGNSIAMRFRPLPRLRRPSQLTESRGDKNASLWTGLDRGGGRGRGPEDLRGNLSVVTESQFPKASHWPGVHSADLTTDQVTRGQARKPSRGIAVAIEWLSQCSHAYTDTL